MFILFIWLDSDADAEWQYECPQRKEGRYVSE